MVVPVAAQQFLGFSAPELYKKKFRQQENANENKNKKYYRSTITGALSASSRALLLNTNYCSGSLK